jgi:glycosyl transferase family 87
MKETKSLVLDRLLLLAGVGLVAAGIVFGWSRAQRGPDFAVVRAMAVGVATGTNVYLLNDPGAVGEGVVGMVYPPAIGFAVLPLAFLSDAVGRVAWFLVMNATLVLGIRSLVRFALPSARDHVWLIASGLVLFSSAVRWGMMLLQGAPFMLGLLCFFIVALCTDKPRLALALATLAVAFKMTLALPFLGLLLLYRRFAAFAFSGAAFVALNALGFLRMGVGAFATYQHNVAVFEAIGPTNINGPDPWMGITLPRLDWVFLFYGITRDLPASRIANLVCTAIVGLWLLREALWFRPPGRLPETTMFLAALVCLGSLCVYHHQYDVCLFFAPLLLILFGSRSVPRPPWASLLVLPLSLMIAFLPIGAAQHAVEIALGPEWVGLLKLTFPVSLTLALLGSLVLLRRCRELSVPLSVEPSSA